MATLKRAKKSATVTPLFSAEEIGKMGKEYADISAQIKQLEERKKSLAEKIKEGAEQFGVKDDKGSFYLENDTILMGKVAKKSHAVGGGVECPAAADELPTGARADDACALCVSKDFGGLQPLLLVLRDTTDNRQAYLAAERGDTG